LKNLLKVERAKRNITQGQLAKHIGVSRQTINAIETGKFVPSTILALKLSQYFKARVEDIFILEDND
jgi:putative transcriptional regulator